MRILIYKNYRNFFNRGRLTNDQTMLILNKAMKVLKKKSREFVETGTKMPNV